MSFEPMHNVSVDPRGFLQARQRHVVPLVVLYDDSDFGREATRMLASMIEPDLAPAVLSGESSNPDSVIAQVASVGFRQRMSPLRLWTHQPLWCAWIADEGTTLLADLARTITALRVPGGSGVENFVFLRVRNAERPNGSLIAELADMASAVFLVSDQAVVHRPLTLLAEGAVALLYSGWRDYCLTGGQSLNKPLLLVPNERIYVLGVSANEPDWDYHAFDWQQKVVAAVLDEWRKAVSISSGDRLETAKKSLDRLLRFGGGWRHSEVVVQPVRSQQNPQAVIQVGKESLEATCQVNYENRAPELGAGSARRKLAAWLGQVKSMDLFLQFVVLANFRRLINSRSDQLDTTWFGDAQALLREGQPVRGFFGNLHQRMLVLLEWANERECATVLTEEATLSFKQQEKGVLKNISNVPNGVGLALRLLLFGSGLFSLLLAPVWASVSANWQHDVLNMASVISGALFLLVTAAGIGHWLFFRSRTVRAVERTRQSVLSDFQAQLSGILAGALNRSGKKVIAQAKEWLEEFANLAQKLGNDCEVGRASEPRNRNPFFPKDCLASILDDRMGSLVQATHEQFVGQWTEQPDPSFAPEIWRKMLSEAARQVTSGALKRLTHMACLKARKPSAQELSYLLADLCQEARIPSLDIVAPPNPPPALLVGHTATFPFADKMRDIQIRELPTAKLLAVSVIPCPVHC